ncbi:MAG: hypothetical protein AAF715_07215 [Myxococcota bacterium]
MGVTAVAVLASATTGGCSGDPEPFRPPSSIPSAGGSGGGGGEEPVVDQGRLLFSELLDDFRASCGACHAAPSDTPFLGPAEGTVDEAYEAVTTWRDFIVRDPETKSELITWPEAGQHSNGPIQNASLKERLIAWLVEEAKSIADTPDTVPTITPFKPVLDGPNSVYLDELGPEFAGIYIAFNASELTDTSLSLDDITVHTAPDTGVALDHPLFTVFPAASTEGAPDPVDSFSNVAQEVEAGASAPLGPGRVVLTNWEVGGKLSVAFSSVDTIIGGGGGVGGAGSGGPCMAVSVFDMQARPALQANCGNGACHGGNGAAANAVDMTALGSDADTACTQIFNRIDLDNPNQSQIFLNTNPNGGTNHPFQFGGNANNFNAFRDSVTIWINAESSN